MKTRNIVLFVVVVATGFYVMFHDMFSTIRYGDHLAVTQDVRITTDWNAPMIPKPSCFIPANTEVIYKGSDMVLADLQYHVETVDGSCNGWADPRFFKKLK